MNETSTAALDAASFQKVWRRVMPEDRADCPFTLESSAVSAVRPPAPVPSPPVSLSQASVPLGAPPQVCLGEGSRSALPELERFLAQAHDSARIYRSLAGRSRRAGRLLFALAAAKDRQVRRLSAARFLILGESFSFVPAAFPQTVSLPLALRERYQAEQRCALTLLTAAQRTADPCLIQLYRDLADEDQSHAGQLREWLEGR